MTNPSPLAERPMPVPTPQFRRPSLHQALATTAIIAAWVLPFVIGDYRVFQMTLVIVSAIALLGLNLLTGYGGQISLGHGAFYAVGAYTAAIAMTHGHLPYWIAIPAAGVICLVAGTLFGWPAARLDNLYLALATFALGVSLPQILKYKKIAHWTGGVQGVALAKPRPPSFLPLSADQWLYFVSLGVMVLVFAGAWNFLRGHAGRAIVAIRDQPIAATAMGIDVAAYKALTFGVSAMFTGVAGALGAIAVEFIGPDSFTFFLSLGFLVGIVTGGLGSLSGAIYGAFFIQYVPTLASEVSKAAPSALYGLVLILVVYAMPTGIAGALAKATARFVTPDS